MESKSSLEKCPDCAGKLFRIAQTLNFKYLDCGKVFPKQILLGRVKDQSKKMESK